jgi:hypothetical protein
MMKVRPLTMAAPTSKVRPLSGLFIDQHSSSLLVSNLRDLIGGDQNRFYEAPGSLPLASVGPLGPDAWSSSTRSKCTYRFRHCGGSCCGCRPQTLEKSEAVVNSTSRYSAAAITTVDSTVSKLRAPVPTATTLRARVQAPTMHAVHPKPSAMFGTFSRRARSFKRSVGLVASHPGESLAPCGVAHDHE